MIAECAVNHSLLVTPYGGNLVDLLVPVEELDELRSYASRLPSLQISERSMCDLELLACGAFSPLDRFVGKEEHQRILNEMRLRSGHIFPIPVPLPVNPLLPAHDIAAVATNAGAQLLLASTEQIQTLTDLETEPPVLIGQPQRPWAAVLRLCSLSKEFPNQTEKSSK